MSSCSAATDVSAGVEGETWWDGMATGRAPCAWGKEGSYGEGKEEKGEKKRAESGHDAGAKEGMVTTAVGQMEIRCNGIVLGKRSIAGEGRGGLRMRDA